MPPPKHLLHLGLSRQTFSSFRLNTATVRKIQHEWLLWGMLLCKPASCPLLCGDLLGYKRQAGCAEGLLNMRRVQKMPYPPPIPLPVPTTVQPRPDGIPGLTLDALELMSDEEAQSNEQLYHSVWLLHVS